MNRLAGRPLTVYLALFVNPAMAQVEHGSIGVTYFSKDKIVMAADSRGIFTVGAKQTPNDRECKVAALSGEVVFNVTGLLGYTSSGPRDPVKSWATMSEAHRASKAYPIAHDHMKEIADKWGELIRADAQLLYAKHPTMVTPIAKSQMGIIASGTLGGFDSSRNLVLFLTQTRFTQSKNAAEITVDTMRVECHPHNFCASGLVEIFTEFDNITSERARDERKTWRPTSTNISDYDLMRTIRFVELAIKYHKGGEIGGPIDAVELQRSSTLHWYARKPNCPEN